MRPYRAPLRQTQTFTCDVIYISIGPRDNPMIFYENDKTRAVVQMGGEKGCGKTSIFTDNRYMNPFPEE